MKFAPRQSGVSDSTAGSFSGTATRIRSRRRLRATKLIDNFETWLFLLPIIDRRDIREKSKIELRVFLQDTKTFAQTAAVKHEDIIALRFRRLENLGTKLILKGWS